MGLVKSEGYLHSERGHNRLAHIQFENNICMAGMAGTLRIFCVKKPSIFRKGTGALSNNKVCM